MNQNVHPSGVETGISRANSVNAMVTLVTLIDGLGIVYEGYICNEPLSFTRKDLNHFHYFEVKKLQKITIHHYVS